MERPRERRVRELPFARILSWQGSENDIGKLLTYFSRAFHTRCSFSDKYHIQMGPISTNHSANMLTTTSKRKGEDDVPQNEKSSRRRLNYKKCFYCRRDKQKVDLSRELGWKGMHETNISTQCLQEDRIWPQKCVRCIEKSLDCSENKTTKGETETIDDKIRKIRDQEELIRDL